MSHNLARDQRREGLPTVEARKRRRMRPTVLALEDRRLMSTFTVTNTLDNGSAGSLRWAVGQANSAGAAGVIAFDQKVFKTAQTITLTGTQLELSDSTGAETITGPKVGVTVSGGGLSRVFQVDGGVTASISGLTITGGSAVTKGAGSCGGGVDNLGGTVTLTNCTVTGNTANESGGGLYNLNGTTTLTNCTVSGNSATFGGAGIYNEQGTAFLRRPR